MDHWCNQQLLDAHGSPNKLKYMDKQKNISIKKWQIIQFNLSNNKLPTSYNKQKFEISSLKILCSCCLKVKLEQYTKIKQTIPLSLVENNTLQIFQSKLQNQQPTKMLKGDVDGNINVSILWKCHRKYQYQWIYIFRRL